MLKFNKKKLLIAALVVINILQQVIYIMYLLQDLTYEKTSRKIFNVY